jgi:protease-4
MKTLRWIILVLFLLFISFALVIYFAFKEEGLKKNTVLKLTISGEIEEWTPKASIPFGFAKKRMSLYDYIKILKDAEKNPKIVGLYLRLKQFSMGPGKIEELAKAIYEFSQKKPSFTYTETFGEFSPANGSVWLASSTNKVYINPDGYVNLIGINAEVPFLRGTLDKLHIYPDFDHIAEYKTAMNLFTEKKFTEAHKEMEESLVNSIFNNMVESISRRRKIKKEELINAISKGPLSAKEALNLKLIDGLLYEDEIEEKLKEIGGKEYNLVSESKYRIEGNGSKEKIALIFGIGGIYVGSSEPSPFGGSSGMGSETISKYFRDARKDKSIKAVIFRVDSPGGSAIASEIIRRELLMTKKEKPVVVSMSDVAGSGGYWVSMSADKILAQPSTLTGSIGVVVGKFNAKGFWEDLLGITFDTVKVGAQADFYSSIQNFTPEQREILKKQMNEIYDEFVLNVSKSRNIPEEKVRQIGKGRVWTGSQAIDLKLIDKIGGYKEAIEEAKKLAKIPEKEEVELVIFPKEKTFFEILIQKEDSELKALVKNYLIKNMPFGPLWCPYRITLN